MKDLKSIAHRGRYLLSASLVTVAAAAPMLIGHAAAYTAAVTNRSVVMSSSKASDTGVSYTIGFTETSTNLIQSVVVDFCGESPIYGAACTAPAGMVTTSSSLSTQTGTSGWSLANATNGHLVFSGATKNSTTAISFKVTGVTNPSANGTFYARIYTYAAQTNDYTGVTTPGTVLDFGGAALSTAKAYTITATVQETLQFCVYTTSCGDTPAITLGHNSGGVTVIDNSAVDVGSVKFDVGSNANGNVAINLYGDTLKNGSVSSIAAKTTAGTLAAGTAGFGLCLQLGANVTASNTYPSGTPCTSSSSFKLDTANTTLAGGQTIASATPQTTTTTTTVTYGATASTTTPAGVYTANHQLIATGTF